MPARRTAKRWLGLCLALVWLPLETGCGLFDPPPQAQPAPTPPVRAARPPRSRPAEPPRTPDAAPPAPAEAETPAPVAEAPAPQPELTPPPPPPPPAPRQEAARPVMWRVLADRTIGCAVPETLRMLRSSDGIGESQPRLAAQARREGRCATTFRISEWALLRTEGDLVLLRLANPPPGVAPLELFFLRRDVTPLANAGEQPAG